MNKSSIILFCSESERYTVEELLNLKIGQVNLKFSDSVKILGLTMESKLSFTGHVKNLRKMYIKLRLLYSNKFILNYKLRKKLCESLIMSLFTYCNGIYFPFLDLQTKNRLQVMQNNCVRFIFEAFWWYSHNYIELTWLKLSSLTEYHALVLIHKIITTSKPEYLREKLICRHELQNLNIRHGSLLYTVQHRTSFFHRCFSYTAPKFYNNISNDVKQLSVAGFRKKIKALHIGR